MAKKRGTDQASTFAVSGMHCASCAQTIKTALEKTDGVKEANVNVMTEKATVKFDPSILKKEHLVEVVKGTGYDAAVETGKIIVKIGGMTCASCAQSVETALRKLDGVIEAHVNIATEKAAITYDIEEVSYQDIEKTINDTGYKALGEEAGESRYEREIVAEQKKLAESKKRFAIAWTFTAPIVVLMMLEMIGGIKWPNAVVHDLAMIVLAAFPQFWAGHETLGSALNAVRHKNANMDLLIALGTLAAFITGPLSFFTPLMNYSGVAAMIMAFHLIGRYVEMTAKGRASQAIRKLLELGAKTARIIDDGEEREIPMEDLQVGDLMLVKPGEKVPTDGQIIDGQGAIDESMATGEAMPVMKQEGDEVIGATINQRGMLKVRATKIGKDTFLAQVIKLVEETQGSKVPIQEFADRVTSYFVPVVLVLAMGAFLAWILVPAEMNVILQVAHPVLPWVDPSIDFITLAFIALIATLVVACPCALGLATPTALMVGSGMGAEHGILIRRGDAIQTLKNARDIVFDKTGTITQGTPVVTDIVPARGFTENDTIQLASSVEGGSEHPLAGAIVDKSRDMNVGQLAISGFESITGKGAKALVGASPSTPVLVGSRKLMVEQGFDTTELDPEIERLEKDAKTVVLVSSGTDLAGIIAIADIVKEDSIQAIKELEKMGIKTTMLTGDNHHTANAIARKIGISNVIAEVLPDEKAREIQRLQQGGNVVVMVGDGINDAPALTAANVGIAIGTGTDIAIESADITLASGKLSGVVSAIKLSRHTFNKIKQNLFWAFFYNIVAIPAAMLGLFHPLIGQIAMATSSVSVVTNANLLRRARIQPEHAMKKDERGQSTAPGDAKST